MLGLALRKLIKNGWLTICLLGGCLLAVAVASSIPIYTEGVLQRMLIKDLESYQRTGGKYPGTYYVKTNFSAHPLYGTSIDVFPLCHQTLKEEFIPEIGLSVKTWYRRMTID